jgi:hypothetical protein
MQHSNCASIYFEIISNFFILIKEEDGNVCRFGLSFVTGNTMLFKRCNLSNGLKSLPKLNILYTYRNCLITSLCTVTWGVGVKQYILLSLSLNGDNLGTFIHDGFNPTVSSETTVGLVSETFLQ